MSVLSLYESSKRKTAINLRDGMYKSCENNLFCCIPSNVVNDLTSATLDLQRSAGFRADNLKPLLTSGKLQELKIHEIEAHQELLKVLNMVAPYCQTLEVLHLASGRRSEHDLRSDVSKALENVLRNAPNLKDLHSWFKFDLKALRNCKTLRSLRLHFRPRQHWHKFLTKESYGDQFQPHESLEFFTVCKEFSQLSPIPNNDIVIILRYCPELRSLGFIESSMALALLRGMCASSSKLKLRQCFWKDEEEDRMDLLLPPPCDGGDRIREAVLHHPMIEELDLHHYCYLGSISCLKDLRNLIYLNIYLHSKITDVMFNDVLREIGPQLKHLSIRSFRVMDMSLLLKNCPNLESFGYAGFLSLDYELPSPIRLPHLQRLTVKHTFPKGGFQQFFYLLSDLNQLTELFIDTPFFDDEVLSDFLSRNSLINLKVAWIVGTNLTEDGFREFLLNAPQLERVVVTDPWEDLESDFEGVMAETKHKALLSNDLVQHKDEFFEKRSIFYGCDNIE